MPLIFNLYKYQTEQSICTWFKTIYSIKTRFTSHFQLFTSHSTYSQEIQLNQFLVIHAYINHHGDDNLDII